MDVLAKGNDSPIPRIIHCCWFGGNPKPQLVLDCMASWRLHMPDWEVLEWSEDNYSVTDATYVREAYEARMWAFVSDYVRFDVLRRHGGLYFDTDVELLKPIPESVLMDQAFTGHEHAGLVSPGLVFGCVPDLPLLSTILDSYEQSHFTRENAADRLTVNQRVTRILEMEGWRREDVLQRVAGLTIYPSEYFCGYDQDIHEARVTQKTIARHHYAHTWGSNRDTQRVRLHRAIKAVIGERAYRSLLVVKRRLFGVRGTTNGLRT